MRVRFLTDVGRYEAGETVDLPRSRAIAYVQCHFAEEDEAYEPPETKEDTETKEDPEDKIKAKGSGWYELPSGDKVRGKDKALREVKE